MFQKIYRILALKRIFSLAVFGILLLAFLIIPTAKAADGDSGNIFLPQGMVYEDAFFAAGENININAEMKDDVYVAGANVVISGPVEGDVIVAGSNVVINSDIKGNLRAVGGTVTIKGKIDKNVTVAGGMVSFDKGSEVGNNVFVGAGNIEINSKIGKNLYAGAGSLILNSEIAGNAYVSIDPEGSFILYPEANIAGNLDYKASQTAEIMSGARIGNEEKFNKWPEKVVVPQSRFNSQKVIFFLAGLLGLMLVGLIFATAFKGFTLKTQAIIDKKILFTILAGFAYLIVTPLALLILAITVIGLPLALILGALYFIALYVSRIFVAIYLGNKILKWVKKKKEPQLIWSAVLGLLALCLLCALPFIGWIFKLAAILWGLGIAMAVIKEDLNLKNI